MKRLLLICVISLLFVSGWSHVLASAFCPNMKDMPDCHMQAENVSTSSHEGREGMEMGDIESRQSATEGKAGALERPLVSCCASRPEVPPAPIATSRGAAQSRQDLGALLKPALKAITPISSSFAPPVTSRQHAPPGTPTARHVLISVFLI
jgi:hypothetical protein